MKPDSVDAQFAILLFVTHLKYIIHSHILSMNECIPFEKLKH